MMRGEDGSELDVFLFDRRLNGGRSHWVDNGRFLRGIVNELERKNGHVAQ